MESMRKHFRFPVFSDSEGAKASSRTENQTIPTKKDAAIFQRRPFMERPSRVIESEEKTLRTPIEMDRYHSYDEPLTEQDEIAAINQQANGQYETAFEKKKHQQKTDIPEVEHNENELNYHKTKQTLSQNEKIATYQQIANSGSDTEMTDETNEMLSVKKQLRYSREEREDTPFHRKQRRNQ